MGASIYDRHAHRFSSNVEAFGKDLIAFDLPVLFA